MKLALSVRDIQKLLLIGVLAIIFLTAYVRFIVGPLLQKSGQLAQQAREAKEQLQSLQTAASNEPTLQTQHQQLEQSVRGLRKFLPSEQEVPAVIEHLSDLAGQTGLKIQAIFPQRSAESDIPSEKRRLLYYKEIPIQIDALAGFHQLGAFLSLVETADKPMTVSSLRISENPKELRRHSIKLLLRAYFAVQEPS